MDFEFVLQLFNLLFACVLGSEFLLSRPTIKQQLRYAAVWLCANTFAFVSSHLLRHWFDPLAALTWLLTGTYTARTLVLALLASLATIAVVAARLKRRFDTHGDVVVGRRH
jgi:membrane-anchored protein YejM (alkaline phosphatase superfamily)